MYFLVYVSSAVQLFSPAELQDLLAKSRANNAQLGISGLLLYKDGNFMQVLEGEQAAVQSLHTHIARDPRHRGLITLLQGTHPERQFPEWAMGFCDLNTSEVRSLPGYSEFLNTPLTGNEFAADPTRCQKLLLTFKQKM
jgi:Sensors of blue-light using FAD